MDDISEAEGTVARVLVLAVRIGEELDLRFGHVEFDLVDGRVESVKMTRRIDLRDVEGGESGTAEIAAEVSVNHNDP